MLWWNVVIGDGDKLESVFMGIIYYFIDYLIRGWMLVSLRIDLKDDKMVWVSLFY